MDDLRFEELLRALPMRKRWGWRLMKLRWAMLDILFCIPGLRRAYHQVSFAISRVRRQGIGGLWEPPFNIEKQDFSAYDQHLRWHGWGVLREVGGYRAHTPTNRSAVLLATSTEAWGHLRTIYWRGNAASAISWEPAALRARASTPSPNDASEQVGS
jgi:hypothetical protein